jgi:predicted small lipoprotein YifL
LLSKGEDVTTARTTAAWFAGLGLAALAGCGAPGPASAPAAALPHYRCDHEIAFTVRFEGDSALLDAGVAQQTVYSNPRMRAEFGLGPNGTEAILHYAQLPLVAHCLRD